FYYWLLSIPLATGAGLDGVLFLGVFLAALSVLLLFRKLKNEFGFISAISGFVLLLSCYFVQVNLSIFWNPSFISLFYVVIINAFLVGPPRKYSQLALIGFWMGLAVQIHMSVLLFFFSAIISLALEGQVPAPRRLKRCFVFICAAFIPLIPYLMWGGHNAAVTHENFFSGAGAFLKLPFFQYWKSEGASNFLKAFFEILSPFFMYDAILVSGLTVMIIKRRFLLPGVFLKMSLIFSLALLAWVASDSQLIRYGLPFFFVLIVGMAITFGQLFKTNPRFIFIWIVFSLLCMTWTFQYAGRYTGAPGIAYISPRLITLFYFFIMIAILFFLARGVPALSALGLGLMLILNFNLTPRKPFPTLGIGGTHWQEYPLTPFLAKVIRETGWTYKEFSRKAFFVGPYPWPWIDFSLAYDQSSKISQGSNVASHFDGLIAIHQNIGTSFWNVDSEHFSSVGESVNNYLPKEIIVAFQTKRIVCKSTFTVDGFHGCLYQFTPTSRKMVWNNIGYSYQGNVTQGALTQERIVVPDPTERSQTFYFYPCDTREEDCSVKFTLILFKDNYLLVRLEGDPIAAPDAGSNPSAATSLTDVTVEVTCSNQSQSYIIANGIGVNPDRKNFLAPFSNGVEIDCPDPATISLKSGQNTILSGYFPKEFLLLSFEWKPQRFN
ncbi:MAG: hypothetical protein AABZ55_10025, partial [Bdellovibrionota bacterium]